MFFVTCILKLCEGYFPDYDPEQIMGDGDGTVNIRFVAKQKAWMSCMLLFYIKLMFSCL
jgi:hypothetical protein